MAPDISVNENNKEKCFVFWKNWFPWKIFLQIWSETRLINWAVIEFTDHWQIRVNWARMFIFSEPRDQFPDTRKAFISQIVMFLFLLSTKFTGHQADEHELPTISLQASSHTANNIWVKFVYFMYSFNFRWTKAWVHSDVVPHRH